MDVKSFTATLERSASRLNWTIARIPFDVERAWGARGQIKVKGDINGFAFRTSLFPDGQGGHILLVNKRMQTGAQAGPGVRARFRLQPDTEKRIAEVPEELKPLLTEDAEFKAWFEKLPYSIRKEIADWITGVKSAEARERRATQIAERLLATMEAERELPPALQTAFARNARAREAWERLPLSHKRRHLLAIFYYRNPEARARRIAKSIQEIEAYGKRWKGSG